MTEQMVKKLDNLCEALNAFEQEFRDALAAHGIQTTEHCFTLKHNKKLLRQLHKAQMKEIQDLAVLSFSKCSPTIQ